MMDEATAELLSRLLDGDLDAADRTRLEARLSDEPELRVELAALGRLREATLAVAERMDPPVTLDGTLEPLRRGVPLARGRIHPAVRWLGMAAGLVLAVTVTIEVARRNPDTAPGRPAGEAAPAPSLDKTEIYQLKALPTSPVTPEEELIGVSERLLASPPAEPELDEPEPLYVQGPLPLEDNEAGFETRDEEKARGDRGVQREPVAKDRPSSAEVARQVAPAPATLDARASGKKLDRAVGTTRLVLRDRDGVVAGEVLMNGSWPGEGPPVEVTVSGGVIVAVGTPGSDKDGFAAGEGSEAALIGAAAPGVPDGRYLASPVAGAESSE